MLKANILASDLSAAAAPAAALADTRPPALPVLSAALLRAEGGTLRLTATDLETSGVTEIPADVAGEGAVAVPARALMDAAASMDGDVSVREDVAWGRPVLRLETPAARAEIYCLDPEEFPRLDFPSALGGLVVAAPALASALARVVWSIAGENMGRYNLTGVHLSYGEPYTWLTASDSQSLNRVPLGGIGRLLCQEEGIMASRKGMALIRDMAASAASVTLEVAGPFLTASAGLRRISARLLEGPFPDWSRLYPEEPPLCSLALSRRQAQEALSRLARFVSVKDNAVRLAWDGSSDTATLSAEDLQVGGATFEIPCYRLPEWPGEGFSVGLDGRALLKAVKALPAGEAPRIDWRGEGVCVAMEGVPPGGRGGIDIGPSGWTVFSTWPRDTRKTAE
jgi:DNA polymerase-3 subunit beta